MKVYHKVYICIHRKRESVTKKGELLMKQNEFEKIYNLYYSRIYSYIKKRISNHQECEDLTNDVFINFYKKMEKFDEERFAQAAGPVRRGDPPHPGCGRSDEV